MQLLVFLVFEGEFQGLTALGADNAAGLQHFFVEVDDIAAGTLYLVDGGILIAEVKALLGLLLVLSVVLFGVE